ncbi:MAG: DUF1294 domain-containing protein [Pirellulales bacterium]|nr:DUF1294 domain-containing protein [Pirellulales bacterium]
MENRHAGIGSYMLAGIAIWTSVASLSTALMFAWDKRAAAREYRRIPERTLLLWSALGGWPGGWIAGRLIRHKTQKMSFRIQFALCAAVHLIIVAAIWFSGRD